MRDDGPYHEEAYAEAEREEAVRQEERMSKADEWAAATAAIDERQCPVFQCKQMPTFSDESPRPIQCDVGRKGAVPMLCLTDGRLGGIYLNGHNAIALARWIQDNFGDEADLLTALEAVLAEPNDRNWAAAREAVRKAREKA